MILNRCYFTMWNTQFAQCVHSIWHSIDNSWVSVLPTSKRIDRKHSKYYSLGFLALYLVVVDAKTSLFTHIFSTDYSNFKITFALFCFLKFFFLLRFISLWCTEKDYVFAQRTKFENSCRINLNKIRYAIIMTGVF